MKTDAREIFRAAVATADPYENTCAALRSAQYGHIRLVLAIGKAAVPMLHAAADTLGRENIDELILVTKYHHAAPLRIPGCAVFECGHPVSDENSSRAAEYVLEHTKNLSADDICLLLLSGGGSALFEKSLVAPEKQREITRRLLTGGADIFTLNCIRKRLSAVKGGKLASHIAPARIDTFALSDVPGNRPDIIASGLTVPDASSEEEFRSIAAQYNLNGDGALDALPAPPEEVPSSRFTIVGDLHMLLEGAAREAERRGYKPCILGTDLAGEASEAAVSALRTAAGYTGKTALLWGGETTVTVRGNGRGGRSQEAALAAAIAMDGEAGIVFLAGGSDGTDGPTDAAGGYADGETAAAIRSAGLDPAAELADNNAYEALAAAGALLMTGPTGTNVNDLFLILKN